MSNEVLEGIMSMLRDGDLSMADDPSKARPIFEAMFEDVPLPEGIHSEAGELSGVPGIWLKPATPIADTVILYLHGGGYVIGSSKVYSPIAAGLAATSNIATFIPDYRLAPEHPFPAAVQDAYICYQALRSTYKERVIIAGDSAGGGLVMSVLLKTKQEQAVQPACAILWSPWLDLSVSGASVSRNAEHDPTLDEESLKTCTARYVGNTLPADEILNPLNANLAGISPLLVQVGSIEILLDDAIALAGKAAAAHCHCQLEVWPGMPHVFQGFAPALAEGQQALNNCSTFITQHCQVAD